VIKIKKQRRLRFKLKESAFFDALKSKVLNQQEFSRKIGSKNPQYLSNLCNPNRLDITASTTYARRVLEGFDNEYDFQHLMYWVD